jgi:hypothetical protein
MLTIDISADQSDLDRVLSRKRVSDLHWKQPATVIDLDVEILLELRAGLRNIGIGDELVTSIAEAGHAVKTIQNIR